jgi:hypothetical protein
MYERYKSWQVSNNYWSSVSLPVKSPNNEFSSATLVLGVQLIFLVNVPSATLPVTSISILFPKYSLSSNSNVSLMFWTLASIKSTLKIVNFSSN